MLTRKADWQSRLQRFLAAHEDRHFAYGSWDCCLWVCDAIQEMTGVDLAASFRNRYTTRTQAYRTMREYAGVASVAVVVVNVTNALDMPEVPVLSAQRGDMALVPRGTRDYSLALVALNGRDLMVCYRRGLGHIPLSRAMRVWSV